MAFVLSTFSHFADEQDQNGSTALSSSPIIVTLEVGVPYQKSAAGDLAARERWPPAQ